MAKRRGMKAKDSFDKYNNTFKKTLKPIKDNVDFPSEGNNKIWNSSLPERFKKNVKGWK